MTLYRGGGLSRVFCTSRTLPSCSCLAIAAQETLPFETQRLMIATDFSSAGRFARRAARISSPSVAKASFRPDITGNGEKRPRARRAHRYGPAWAIRTVYWFKSGQPSEPYVQTEG